MDFEAALQDKDTLANPYALYRQMRSDAPIYYCQRAGAWVVMRYDDIAMMLGDERFGCTDRFGPIVAKKSLWLVNSDGPTHLHCRRSVALVLVAPMPRHSIYRRGL